MVAAVRKEILVGHSPPATKPLPLTPHSLIRVSETTFELLIAVGVASRFITGLLRFFPTGGHETEVQIDMLILQGILPVFCVTDAGQNLKTV